MAAIYITPWMQIKDTEFTGQYRVVGTASELGVPGAYRVMLFRRRDGRLIGRTFSLVDGSYVIDYVPYFYQGYFAVAFDHAAPWHNAAIADLITPEPMP